MPHLLQDKQYMTFEVLQVTLYLVMYSLCVTLHLILPVVLSRGQYLRFLVWQGLRGFVFPMVWGCLLGSGSLALTKKSLTFLGFL